MLKQCPFIESLVGEIITAYLTAIIVVLERQYKRYFEMELTAELKKETVSQVTQH